MDTTEVAKIINLAKPWIFGGDADRCMRNGTGSERWKNDKIQQYQGPYHNDSLHGHGIYNWGGVSYEGRIYANNIHGYGVMSYPDGRYFEGLYKKNQRFVSKQMSWCINNSSSVLSLFVWT